MHHSGPLVINSDQSDTRVEPSEFPEAPGPLVINSGPSFHHTTPKAYPGPDTPSRRVTGIHPVAGCCIMVIYNQFCFMIGYVLFLIINK